MWGDREREREERRGLEGNERDRGSSFSDFETQAVGEERKLQPYLVSAVFVCSECESDSVSVDSSQWRQRYCSGCRGPRKRAYWFQVLPPFFFYLFLSSPLLSLLFLPLPFTKKHSHALRRPFYIFTGRPRPVHTRCLRPARPQCPACCLELAWERIRPLSSPEHS